MPDTWEEGEDGAEEPLSSALAAAAAAARAAEPPPSGASASAAAAAAGTKKSTLKTLEEKLAALGLRGRDAPQPPQPPPAPAPVPPIVAAAAAAPPTVPKEAPAAAKKKKKSGGSSESLGAAIPAPSTDAQASDPPPPPPQQQRLPPPVQDPPPSVSWPPAPAVLAQSSDEGMPPPDDWVTVGGGGGGGGGGGSRHRREGLYSSAGGNGSSDALLAVAAAAERSAVLEQMRVAELGGTLQALRQARRLFLGGVPWMASEAQLLDAINASMVSLGLAAQGDAPCLAVSQMPDKGCAFAEFTTLAAAATALSSEMVPCSGVPVRLQRPRDYRPLELRPPDASVTACIDALIRSGAMQPAHITDRLWELLHVLEPSVVLAALADWPLVAQGSALAPQEGAAALASLCQRHAGVKLLDVVMLPQNGGGAPPQVQPPSVVPPTQRQRASPPPPPPPMSYAPEAGVRLVPAATHTRWLMCNAALVDRWLQRRSCIGCGVRLLCPHGEGCTLPGVDGGAPYGVPQAGLPCQSSSEALLRDALALQQRSLALQQASAARARVPPPGYGTPAPVSPPPSASGGVNWMQQPQVAAPPRALPQPQVGRPLPPPPPGALRESQWAGVPPPPAPPAPWPAQQHAPLPLPRQAAAPPMARMQAPQPLPPPPALPRPPSATALPRPAQPAIPVPMPPQQLSNWARAASSPAAQEEEEDVCPICAENIDATDKAFFPCPCGFQPCIFCYHRILEIGDARCPACRRGFGVEEAGVSSSSEDSDQDSDDEPAAPAPVVGPSRGARGSARRGTERVVANK